MKKLFWAAALAFFWAPAIIVNAGLYYGNIVTPSSDTVRVAGQLQVANPSFPFVPTVVIDGALNGGQVTAPVFSGSLAFPGSGRIPFNPATNFTTTSSTFVFTNGRLGVGTAAPGTTLDLGGGILRQGVTGCVNGLTTDSNGGITGCATNPGTTSANNTWTGTNTYNSSVTFNGSLAGLWNDVYVATMTVSGTASGSFVVTLSSFVPNLPVGTSVVPLIIVYPVTFLTSAPGGAGSTAGFGSSSGSPFHGSNPRAGVYTNVSINDQINFSLNYNSGGGGSGNVTFLLIAVM